MSHREDRGTSILGMAFTLGLALALVSAAPAPALAAGVGILTIVGGGAGATATASGNVSGAMTATFGNLGAPVATAPAPGPSFVAPGAPAVTGFAGPAVSTTTPIAINTSSNTREINNGPDGKWGDPLSTDLLDSSKVHMNLHYYSDVGRTGSQQGIGISFSLTD